MKGIKVAFVFMSAGISFAEAAEQLFLYLVDYFRGRIVSSVKETLRRNKLNWVKNYVMDRCQLNLETRPRLGALGHKLAGQVCKIILKLARDVFDPPSRSTATAILEIEENTANRSLNQGLIFLQDFVSRSKAVSSSFTSLP